MGEGEGVLERTFTSQLTLLDDAEFAEGLARIEDAAARAAPEELMLEVDLDLFASYATKPG